MVQARFKIRKCLPPKHVFLIMGLTHSGKDSIARIIQTYYPDFENIKFSGAMKRAVESIYGLEPGASEHVKYDRIYPDSDLTYLDVMVGFWRYVPKIDERMMLQAAYRQASKSDRLLFTDVRSDYELDWVEAQYPNYEVIYVTSPNAKPRESDSNLCHLVQRAMENSLTNFYINNDGDLDHLECLVVKDILDGSFTCEVNKHA